MEEAAFSKFLHTCDIPAKEYKPKPFIMVIFGGGGDLSKRKLVPSVSHIFNKYEPLKGSVILSVDRLPLNDEKYRAMMKEAAMVFDDAFDDKMWEKFSRRLFYLSGTFEDDRIYQSLRERISGISAGVNDVIYYLAVPSQVAPLIVEKLKKHNICKWEHSTKLIVEKPFGTDRKSAAELNKLLATAFDEDQIYRIDHYLGKEPVQNIIFLRFSNALFEEKWNRRYIDNVQITVSEDIGVEHRGAFYEATGVVRDIVQNHIMQLIGLIAMEPPIGFEANEIRDEKSKVIRSIQPLDENYIDKFTVRGQYGPGKVGGKDVPGYREEVGVPGSNTPTFMAAKFHVANWRWAGVPFYVRTGKRMQKRIAEICIQFKQPPLKLFGRTCDPLESNMLSLTIQPDEKITIRFGVKYPNAPNQIYSVNMQFSYQETFKLKPHPAYERLLIDCMKGDLTLFVRQDALEAMWEVVDPIIARWDSNPPKDFPNYAAGTWGPLDAQLLIEKEGRRWATE